MSSLSSNLVSPLVADVSLRVKGGGGNLATPLDLPNTVLHLDPQRIGDFFQDVAGTVAVTSPGDPIGLFINPVGVGNYNQPLATAQPTYQGDYIEGNGGDYLTTTTHRLGLVANPAITITMLVEMTSASSAYVFSLGTAGSAGTIHTNLNNSVTEGVTVRFLNGYHAFGNYTTNEKAVISWVRTVDGTIGDTTAFKNGVELSNTTGANPDNVPNNGGDQSGIFAQANGSSSLTGRIYGLTVSNSSNSSVREAIESFWLSRM